MLERCLQADALSVPSEEAAVMSLLKWIGHDLQERRSLLPKLLPLLRLHHLPPHTLTVRAHTHTHTLKVHTNKRMKTKLTKVLTAF